VLRLSSPAHRGADAIDADTEIIYVKRQPLHDGVATEMHERDARVAVIELRNFGKKS
jgi:hypothetical protein